MPFLKRLSLVLPPKKTQRVFARGDFIMKVKPAFRVGAFGLCMLLLGLDITVLPTPLPSQTEPSDTFGNYSPLLLLWTLGPLPGAVLALIVAVASLTPWRWVVGSAWASGDGSSKLEPLGCVLALAGESLVALSALCWPHSDRSGVGRTSALSSVSVLGWLLRRWSKYTLGALFTYQISKPDTLVTEGPYQTLIHPGYAGVLGHILGTLMLLLVTRKRRVISVLACFGLACAAIVLRVIEEEKMLEQHFGVLEWQMHTSSRYRLLPYVW